MLSTRTGRVVAVEALARPPQGTIHALYRAASKAVATGPDRHRPGRPTQLLAAGESHTVSQDPTVPLHVNVLAATAARPDEMMHYVTPVPPAHRPQHSAAWCWRSARRSCPGAAQRPAGRDREACAPRASGSRWTVSAAVTSPLALLAEAAPDMYKVDSHLLAGLPDDPATLAMLEALAQLATKTDTRLAAVGVDNSVQLLSLSRLGVRVAQGIGLADAVQEPDLLQAMAEAADPARDRRQTAAGHGLPAPGRDAAGDRDRRRRPVDPRGPPGRQRVVLVDDKWVPQFSIDRSRFLLIVAGPYGHALHAKRAAARHADSPLLIEPRGDRPGTAGTGRRHGLGTHRGRRRGDRRRRPVRRRRADHRGHPRRRGHEGGAGGRAQFR